MIIDYNRREIEKITKSLKNDPVIRERLYVPELDEDDKGTSENRTENRFYRSFSTVIANYIYLIKAYTIEEISNPDFVEIEIDKTDLFAFRNSLAEVMALFNVQTTLDDELFKRIVYNIKYFSIREFFVNNYDKFIPSYDLMNIDMEKEDGVPSKNKLLVKAFMKEFDRFASIIEDISYITDIDFVPSEYINYLSQLVGNQKDMDDSLFTFITFREFVKNVIEIYKIKGTPYSIELFLGFIGFSVDIKEFWFDRRFYYLDKNRDYTDKDVFIYYLTETDPRNNFINGIEVQDRDITGTKNLYEFNRRIKNGESVTELLGMDGSNQDPYTYFKTNIVELDVTPYVEKTSIDPVRQEVITNYIKFLTPVFIQTYTNYNLLEAELSATLTETIYLFDLDKTIQTGWVSGITYPKDAIIHIDNLVFQSKVEYVSRTNNKPWSGDLWRDYWFVLGRSINAGQAPDYMFHIYSGNQPPRYWWEDTNYANSLGADFKKGQGGIYPSGFYKGVTQKMNEYDFNKSYLENIETLGLHGADVIKRFQDFPTPYNTYMYSNIFPMDNQIILMNKNMEYVKGSHLRNSYAINEQTNLDAIKGISLANNEIQVLKHSSDEFDKFKIGDVIELFSASLANRGIYTIKSIREETPYLYIKLEEALKEEQTGSGGNFVLHLDEWRYEDFTFDSLHLNSVTWEEVFHA